MPEAAEKKRVTILDRKIRTFAPMENGDPYIAVIDKFTFCFRGDTPMQAYTNANNWRKAEFAKLQGKPKKPAAKRSAAPAAPEPEDVAP